MSVFNSQKLLDKSRNSRERLGKCKPTTVTWNYDQPVLQLVGIDDGHLPAIFVDGGVLIIIEIIIIVTV